MKYGLPHDDGTTWEQWARQLGIAVQERGLHLRVADRVVNTKAEGMLRGYRDLQDVWKDQGPAAHGMESM